ncbi:cytochrome c-type biogenesis protein [Thalassotalea piscium]|uniref:Cytochrome c-type biogenesis protein n=1 Tax=Thalassotalea piscium TaxID=1230533 RepID=A0A7X0TS42_9GAMM|nr:cytochrome c-type biogenesis protein [Thalassotalea piscium]MBB6541741.1 cytochrome c-type biogenesis protein CcmH [Thalassotalea piscium]
MNRLVIFIASIIFAFNVSAFTSDTYTFDDEVTQIRYNALVKELRCPKCQNQNLADSNSPIAADLRREVYELLQLNKSDGEIVDFMVERYGEFVLYRPKFSALTYILWFGPAILLFIGVVIVMFVLKNSAKKKQPQQLSTAQKNKLEQILKDK